MASRADQKDELNQMIFRLDSRDRTDDSNSNTDFRIETLPLHVRVLRLKQVIIPNLFDNIRAMPASNRNSSFVYTTGGGLPQTIVLPDGFYSLGQLHGALELELAALSITFAYDEVTGQTTVMNGGVVAFELRDAEDGNTMADALGISETVTIAPGGTYVITNRPNLYNHSMVYVASERLSNGYNLIADKKRLPIIATVPVDVEYGRNILYEPHTLHNVRFTEQNGSNIESCDIKLINHDGEVLPLPSNHNIQVLCEYDTTNVY